MQLLSKLTSKIPLILASEKKPQPSVITMSLEKYLLSNVLMQNSLIIYILNKLLFVIIMLIAHGDVVHNLFRTLY